MFKKGKFSVDFYFKKVLTLFGTGMCLFGTLEY